LTRGVTIRRFTATTALACLLWLAAGTYTATFMYRGWIPHDEGTIGQSAERVLAGELPHRDFDDTYTGGLAYLHAAAMRIFGVNLRAPRIVVFAFFMGFLAAVYGIARRLASPLAGLFAIVLATVWSLPNYFVSLPSWYNLFLATFGVLAFMRYLDNGRRRWLVVAGACGGLSILAKITGVYYLAGGVLFLAFLEQDRAAAADQSPGSSRSGFWVVAAIPSVVLFLLCAALARSVPVELLFLFLPPLAICVFVAWREWVVGRGALGARIAGLTRLIAPFAAGAAMPIGLFVLFYWQHHGLPELYRGVFVLPQRRLAEANLTPPSVATIGLSAPYVVLLLAGRDRAMAREGLTAACVMVLAVVAIVLGRHEGVYQGIWALARAMPLAATAAGIAVIARTFSSAANPAGRLGSERLFLVVTMAAMVALVQFPYATPIYFSYAAPMTMLALLGIVFATPLAPRRIHLAVAALLFLFAAVFVNRSYAWNLGLRHIPFAPSAMLDGDRGGLRVSDLDARTYGDVVTLAREHAAGGTIFAGPDCPEVYFLAHLPNPTRMLFDFLSPQPLDAAAMTDLLSRAPIRAAVVNTTPEFSPRLDAGVLAVLERRFPTQVRAGKFVVRY